MKFTLFAGVALRALPMVETIALFVWLISHQPAVLFSQNKSAISNLRRNQRQPSATSQTNRLHTQSARNKCQQKSSLETISPTARVFA
jgi:hypothetical protein